MAHTHDLIKAAEIGDLFVFQHLPRSQNIDSHLDDSGNTLLSIAVGHGHKEIVELLVAGHGANINVQNKYGETPLSRAVSNRYTDVVKILLGSTNISGVDPKSYEQAVYRAAQYGSGDIVTLLLENDSIDSSTKNKYASTAIGSAAENGKFYLLKQLLAICEVDLSLQNDDGLLTLNRAARTGQRDVVKLLLGRHDIDVNAIDIDGNTALHGALRSGKRDVVELLLGRDGININATNNRGNAALHQATRPGNTELLKLLLARDEIDMNATDEDGHTALYQAVKARDMAAIELLLLNKTVDINTTDEDIHSFLHQAIILGNTTILQSLLARDETIINATDKDGRTILHRAARAGKTAVVQLLLARDDLDVNAKDGNKKTPLHEAASYDSTGTVKLLLARNEINATAKSSNDKTPLHKAARYGHTEIAELFLARDEIDVNAKDIDNKTPLHKAARYGHTKTVKALLERDEIDVNARDTSQWTALDWALQNGHLSVIELLLAKKDIDWDANGISLEESIRAAAINGYSDILDILLARYCAVCPSQSPLSWSAENGNIEALKCLLTRYDGNINSKDGGGRTPISRGAEKGHQQVVGLLLSHNADANLKDGDGKTPLWWAAENSHEASVELLMPVDTGTLLLLTQDGNQAAIELLLRFKPRLDHRNHHGQTALHLAVLSGHLSITRSLISQGAEINPKDSYGMTPLQLATQRKQNDIIQELLKHKAYTKGIMAKEWRDAYGKQYDATILLCEAAKGEQYLTFPTTFLTSEELSQPTSKGKSRLYLLTDDLHCLIWSRLPVPKLEQGQLKPNDLQILMRRNKDNTLDFSISLWLPIKQYLHDQTAKIDDQKLHRIAWKILRPTKPGNSWTSILYLSTLPYGWIPESEMDLFEQFLRHINAQWLELCHMLEECLSKRGVQQLEFKGKNPEMMDNLAKEAQNLANLRIILAGQISAAKEFLELYCPHYSGSQVPQGMLELLNNDIGLDIGRRLAELEQRVRDLLHIEFAWITINETRISTKLGQNVMLLTYVSIFYLPLGFCAALWAIPNITEMSTRTPFILTATIVSLVTLVVTFNMDKVAAIMQRVYQPCRSNIADHIAYPIAFKWNDVVSNWKKRKATQSHNLP